GVLYFTGDSLNLLALMGLMLAVGMVVDNAIVVVETIYRRRADGEEPRTAAIRGTAEVNLAIVLSTLTTMVVFLPVILMSENAMFSFFMGALGRPVIYALAASLIVALIFAPLATRYISKAQVKEDPRWLRWTARQYRRTLGLLLRHRVDATIALMAVIILTFTVAGPGVNCTDSAEGNLNNFIIRFELPPQADQERREEIVATLEEVVEENRKRWGVRVYRTRLRGDSLRGRIWVYLETETPMTREEVMDEAKEKLPEMPAVTAQVGWDDEGGGGTGNNITLTISGEDTSTLRTLAHEVARRIRPVEGVIDTHVDVENEGRDEIRLIADRQALTRYGLTAMGVGQTVSYAMRGTTLRPIRDGEREIEVQSQIALEDRETLDGLLDFGVWSGVVMRPIPIRALTRTEIGRGPLDIERVNRRTGTNVTIDLEEEATIDDVFLGIELAMKDMVLPQGYSWEKGKRFMNDQENDDALGFALFLSVTFVFLIMGVLFESFVLPLSIITTVPMAIGGAVWGLFLSGTTMDTMAGVGLVILVGVVVNNGIVLVDLVTQLRNEGVPRNEALLQAGARRFRPILMTALTTICGLIPMAVGSSAFIGIPYAPLGRTVIGGLAAGTVLTLFFVPFLYTLLDDARQRALDWAAYIGGRA
ncbi:MAG: efflux RND transporter permease subunit, partial [Proteobacteria bacterium]|nr:efflux RND transporter permease subunit [Pseudomonadota bacterium]